MRSSPLMALLFNSGLPVSGYTFEQHASDERDAMLQRLSAVPGTVVTTNPAVTLIEIEATSTIYLVTQPGHFAHPSLIRRSLHTRDGVRAVHVQGFTAAPPDIMATWLGQLRVQDESVGRSFAR